MAIRVALRHHTRYSYDRPVTLLPQTLRLKPAAHCRTLVEAYSLRVTPSKHFIHWQQDPFGNYLARLVFPDAVKEFAIEVDLVADLATINPFDFFLEPQAEHYPFEYEPTQKRDLGIYLETTEAGPRFCKMVETIRREYASGQPRMVDLLVDINRLVLNSLRYDIRLEPGVFSPEETLSRGHGSCRDFAWLVVHLLRSLGIAARFVSGYSVQLVADQKPLKGPAGVSSDCTDLHAWAEAYLPGAGWIGLDATSGLMCGEGHIPLACTANPAEAAPISGSFDFEPLHAEDKVHCDFDVAMAVTRIEDRPRPTKSYTELQWKGIVDCGTKLDAILLSEDVRLTMGGEPTFVSVSEMEAAEWNTEALGPTKAVLSEQLIRRLHEHFAPGGLIVHGQGKWYPGEPLPRWAYSLYFRKDGEPIWGDQKLIDNGQGDGYDAEVALQFITHLNGRLGLPEGAPIAAYEDTFYYLWRERQLPCNVDPFESKLDDALERAQLRHVFEQGLTTVVGYVLPLCAKTQAAGGHRWETNSWPLRSGRLYLLPGNSPMGFRLPLDSLPWGPAEERAEVHEPDPHALPCVLHTHAQLSQPRPPSSGDSNRGGTPTVAGSGAVVHTALCVESRTGVLYVFLPPLPNLDAYLELVAQLEATARTLRVTIRLEGYPPPYHPSLERLAVTPDPGVVEVNIHPASSWSELVSNTTTLYSLARETGLGTDKFLIDGRHTGTGGGNHIVLGGATPEDSPFLRRPELVTSLVAFFNNHPSLSYVFSGLFVGPTSQAPRLDEARNDSLYELEIARGILSATDGTKAPWAVDRALRHLLVDVTGNTHRAEFCIDKLFSPDSATGRLGLLELRAFEMPPDSRMSCAQQLLVRALVAHCWRSPYRRRLVRWGSTLHDRFALPHFLWADLRDVIEELEPLGIALDPDWFLPHWEFRFPRLGTVSTQGIEVELRQALEPWHVLGEEQSAGGTARYVDSSVERVQVLVNGLTESRHCLSVAGRKLPLCPTGENGQFVAAIRYKAWKPPSSLHPTLDVDVPLTVDIHDTWSGRAIGGLTYHVSHPGGRAFDTFPTNGLEAESRRLARFSRQGHSTFEGVPLPPCPSLEFPLTLDLRT